jgi:hypothetical protein
MRRPDEIAAFEKLRRIIQKLKGQPVSRIIAGGSAGSIIGIEFDEKDSETGSAEQAEWYLGVECAWRLDDKQFSLTSSLDDNSPEGHMLRGLNSLLGVAVSEATVSEPAYDLKIDFSDGKRLTVFCDVVRDGACWYVLGPEKTEVSVEPAGNLVFGEEASG